MQLLNYITQNWRKKKKKNKTIDSHQHCCQCICWLFLFHINLMSSFISFELYLNSNDNFCCRALVFVLKLVYLLIILLRFNNIINVFFLNKIKQSTQRRKLFFVKGYAIDLNTYFYNYIIYTIWYDYKENWITELYWRWI